MGKSSNPVRGTRDILPAETKIRDRIEARILKIYQNHGFERIETPAIESLDLMLNSDGGENLQMLFTILKRGKKLDLHADAQVQDICDIGLRYDLTLPLSRFYSKHKQELSSPFKSIQIGNVYRAERPQKGRFRSFKQCDIDIIGQEDKNAEIELIDTTSKALRAIGFEAFVIRINDRRILSELIVRSGYQRSEVPSVSIILDKLDKIGEDGVEKELTEKFNNPQAAKNLVETIKGLTEENLHEFSFDPDVVVDLQEVIRQSRKAAGQSYRIVFDPTLVRGMGYYTGMIFEVSYGPYGFSIAGGGRYDEMIGKFTGEKVPAVGFSIGFERIVTILLEEEEKEGEEDKKLALIYEGEDEFSEVIKQGDEFRRQGYQVFTVERKKKLGKQMEQLKQAGCRFVLLRSRDAQPRKLDE